MDLELKLSTNILWCLHICFHVLFNLYPLAANLIPKANSSVSTFSWTLISLKFSFIMRLPSESVVLPHSHFHNLNNKSCKVSTTHNQKSYQTKNQDEQWRKTCLAFSQNLVCILHPVVALIYTADVWCLTWPKSKRLQFYKWLWVVNLAQCLTIHTHRIKPLVCSYSRWMPSLWEYLPL